MNAFYALVAVAVLLGLVYVGVGLAGMDYLFGVVVPYAAIVLFLAGVTIRILQWAGAPVPYRVTTTCGQQKTLPWIRSNRFESPFSAPGVIGRMAGEVLLFRSLFRNTKVSLTPAKRVAYDSDKLLWAGAMAFHWAFLVILIRHLRFFIEPSPSIVRFIENFDGFFQLTVPTFFLTDGVIIASLVYLLGRRLFNAGVRYISLPADYLALFILLAVMISGVSMRYLTKVELVPVKELALGLVTLSPVLPKQAIGLPFYIHLFFVSALFAYFPFSKLMHMGGVFLSPTRNMANDNRARHHTNYQNPEVKVHTYDEWEDEFRDKLKAAGYPLEKE